MDRMDKQTGDAVLGEIEDAARHLGNAALVLADHRCWGPLGIITDFMSLHYGDLVDSVNCATNSHFKVPKFESEELAQALRRPALGHEEVPKFIESGE